MRRRRHPAGRAPRTLPPGAAAAGLQRRVPAPGARPAARRAQGRHPAWSAALPHRRPARQPRGHLHLSRSGRDRSPRAGRRLPGRGRVRPPAVAPPGRCDLGRDAMVRAGRRLLVCLGRPADRGGHDPPPYRPGGRRLPGPARPRPHRLGGLGVGPEPARAVPRGAPAHQGTGRDQARPAGRPALRLPPPAGWGMGRAAAGAPCPRGGDGPPVAVQPVPGGLRATGARQRPRGGRRRPA